MDLAALLQSLEGPDFEAKAAQGGLPNDVWETYSAFANTNGGNIVLGLKEENDRLVPLGLSSPTRMRKALFDGLNNRNKVSVNILREEDVTIEEVEGKRLLVVRVPKAPRKRKPVYINNDPLRGTFRRLGSADYRCSEEMMRRMWAEHIDVRDSAILNGFGLGDLDPGSLAAYRTLFLATAPDHPWQTAGDQEILTNLGGWRKDRETGEEGPTLAGLVMFGRERPLLDALPRYHLDYRESDAADPETRWTYRHTVDGRWPPNLFEFYRRTITRLTRDLAIPFRLHNLQRVDDSHVAEALREALVNALIHADHEANGGIVVMRMPELFAFENPGDIRLPLDQVLAGGVSDCRNPSLQRMFRMVGLGEQAGSGIPRMQRAWAEQMWRTPALWDEPESYRTTLLLATVSLLPDGSLRALRDLYGQPRFGRLSQDEVLAAVTAHVEGQVSRGRLATMTSLHPFDIGVMLRTMAAEGLLAQAEARRGVYRLPVGPADSSTHFLRSSTHLAGSSTHLLPDSAHSPVSSAQLPLDLAHSPELPPPSNVTPEAGVPEGDSTWEALSRIAEAARIKRKLPLDTLRRIIIALCGLRALRLSELASLTGRHPPSLRQRHLIPLIQEGRLRYLYAGEPTHPQQAYVSATSETGTAPEQAHDH